MSVVVVVTAFPIAAGPIGTPPRGALAGLRTALEGKLRSGLDVQVLVPHPAGTAQQGAL